jgi:hypothetical protein
MKNGLLGDDSLSVSITAVHVAVQVLKVVESGSH